METLNRTIQARMTPEEALARLKEGNARFVANRKAGRDLAEQVRLTASGQYPFAIVLGCVDSRVAPELIFDQGIGDIFVARVAGNFVNDDIVGSMEFATKVAGAKLIFVLGHSHCGAIQGAIDGVKLGTLTTMLARLEPAVAAVPAPEGGRTSHDAAFVQQVAEKNVALTIEAIGQQSPVLKEMLEKGEIGVAGGMYDIETGEVTFFAR